ncbi:DUF6445 family protein [Sphingomonas sp. SUN019]|uniref:DUF6445 family protein n=1 Tax=Sphingomonas sp. SUN019 TaxID=2937788 RepID=UPI002164C8B3|nr:DUF6445 family protein [Sphingomonas sp. SUN019]UVO49722.1 DUF6445 family protein [Sphingomonas sp. SUN019]
MTPALRHVGTGRHPVVVVDGFSGDVAGVRALAAALAPFPRAGNYYPGVRRTLTPADRDGWAYFERTLEAVAPFVGGAFDIDSFRVAEASFSIVTASPALLLPAQRAPHFDSLDPKHLAVMHYLSDTPDTGTAFFRQRATGIEAVDAINVDAFIVEAKRAGAASSGYIHGSTSAFEEIGRVEGVVDRLVIYSGRLLHSGLIPEDMIFSADPRIGRLTANLFIQGH